jgi:hypothetical protein
MIDPAIKTQAGLKFSNPQISQKHTSRICFITHGCHVIRDLILLPLIIAEGSHSNLNSNKCVVIMALKPNQLQVTTIHAQANANIEQKQKNIEYP